MNAGASEGHLEKASEGHLEKACNQRRKGAKAPLRGIWKKPVTKGAKALEKLKGKWPPFFLQVQLVVIIGY